MAPGLEQRKTQNEASHHTDHQYSNGTAYVIRDEPIGILRPKRVVCLGAGAQGICFSKYAQEKLENVEVQVYDKNHDVGGTWLENCYPGCACDIPSVNYQFSWHTKLWSHYYSGAQEIWEYFNSIVEKYGLRKYMKFKHTVVRAEWDNTAAQWNLTIRKEDGSTFVDICDYFLNGSGVLNNWKMPDIKGLKKFKGVLAHSAAWDKSIELDGKRVAVIGAGSSGVQLVANIQARVEHLYTWIRSPIWITVGFAQRFAGKNGENYAYSKETHELFDKDPIEYLKYRKLIEKEASNSFKVLLRGTDEALAAKEFSKNEMLNKLASRPDLIEKIIPKDFAVGCRRPTPGNGYLEALIQPNVTTYTEQLQEVTEKGFIDHEGVEHEVDVIVCATGFDTSFVPRFPIIANGQNLQDLWAKDACAYLSLMVPKFPNYFVFYGPYTAANGSHLLNVEIWSGYVCKMIKKSQLEDIRSFAPREDVTRQFQQHADLFMKRTVWTDPCRSWFKGGTKDGKPRLFPGFRAQFVQIMESVRYEDFEIDYTSSNRFAFFGNGFATQESDGRDSTWYLGLLEGKDEEPDYPEHPPM